MVTVAAAGAHDRSVMTHEEFIRQFEECTLPASEWTHAAHIRMAWFYLSHCDYRTGLSRIRNGIRQYNAEVLDKLTEYHETVTVAFAQIIASRIRKDGSWEEFVNENPDLFDKMPILIEYYSPEVLQSVEARTAFIAPDRADLP